MDLKRGECGALPHGRRYIAGFSIIELILILAIVVVLYAMFVPRYTYRAIRKHQVYSTAHDLAADLRYAQELSTRGGLTGNSGKKYVLKLYTVAGVTNTWKIFEDGNEAEPIKSVTVLPGVYLNEPSTDTFFFDSNGTVNPLIGAAVEVHDTENIYQWDVSVVRGTGRVKLIGLSP